MKMAEVLIVGAGASGLMAANKLAKEGKNVVVLEGRAVSGGRIRTTKVEGKIIEEGAEFIHGKVKRTFDLLKKANIPFEEFAGNTLQYKFGQYYINGNFLDEWDLLMGKLHEIKEEITMAEFLQKYFSGPEHERLRRSVKNFLEGYDAAHLEKASALALREEWSAENDSPQFRIAKGYISLVQYLESEFIHAGGEIHFNKIVKTVRYEDHPISVLCSDGSSYSALKVIVTTPIGVLTAPESIKASITFIPPIPQKIEAAKKVGYGTVIKVVLDFEEDPWIGAVIPGVKEADLEDLGFLLSEAEIPTWWTQNPHKNHLFTGWLAGPRAEALIHEAPDEIIRLALDAVAFIFRRDVHVLQQSLRHAYVFNWGKDDFALGAYSYPSVNYSEALQQLRTPVMDRVFFGGEACGIL